MVTKEQKQSKNTIIGKFTNKDLKDKRKSIHVSESQEIDGLGTVHLLHYDVQNEGSTIPANASVGHIRGTVVDPEGNIILESFGYTKVLDPIKKISYIQGDPSKSVQIDFSNDDTDSLMLINPDITFFYEGCVSIRVVMLGGVVYVLTHRRINTIKSTYPGLLESFYQMFYTASGLTNDKLFDMSSPHSSSVYHFLIVNPKLLSNTKRLITKSFCIFLKETKSDWLAARGAKPGVLNINNYRNDDIGPEMNPNERIVRLTHASTDSSLNTILNDGFSYGKRSADPRCGLGEGVHITYGPPENRTSIRGCGIASYNRRIALEEIRDVKRAWIAWTGLVEDILSKGIDISPIIPYRTNEQYNEILAQVGNKIVDVAPSTLPHQQGYRKFSDLSAEQQQQQVYIHFLACLPPNKQQEAYGVVEQLQEYDNYLVANLQTMCNTIPADSKITKLLRACEDVKKAGGVTPYLQSLDKGKRYTIYRATQMFLNPRVKDVSSDSDEEILYGEEKNTDLVLEVN